MKLLFNYCSLYLIVSIFIHLKIFNTQIVIAIYCFEVLKNMIKHDLSDDDDDSSKTKM